MSKRIIITLCTSVIICVGVPSHLACQSQKKDKRHEGMMEMVKRIDSNKIDFYGKVLDEQREPVDGAEIILHLKRFSALAPPWYEQITDISLKSDKEGNFSIINEKGRDIFIANINKKGYEHSFKYKTKMDYSYSPEMDKVFVPDPKNPVVFWMRKKGEQAFVFESNGGPNFSFKQEESGTQRGVDIIHGLEIKEKDLPKPTFNGDPLFCDLKAKAIFDPKTKTWTMVLTPGGSEGGILFSDKLLYEAPAEGYLPSYTIQPDAFRKAFGLTESAERVEKGQAVQNPGIYLYLRSRTPGLYSRTHITHLVANKDEIYLSGGGTVLNPYGDRILEQATDLPGELKVQLGNEVRETCRLNPNAHPPKPDLQKLIQEAEKKKSLLQRILKR